MVVLLGVRSGSNFSRGVDASNLLFKRSEAVVQKNIIKSNRANVIRLSFGIQAFKTNK